jgi:hypothetical protein
VPSSFAARQSNQAAEKKKSRQQAITVTVARMSRICHHFYLFIVMFARTLTISGNGGLDFGRKMIYQE